jgi:hypothetical protein
MTTRPRSFWEPSFWEPAFGFPAKNAETIDARIIRETNAVARALLVPLLPLLVLLLSACAPEASVSGAPPADTGDAYRRCGRVRCASVTENCYGGPGLVCTCTTVTCRDRCSLTVVTSEPDCVVPQPIDLARQVVPRE